MANESSALAPDAASLQHRARLGIALMAGRSVVNQLIVLGGNIHLYRLLSPADYGLFAIVQFAIAFFRLFGDAGLAAALIQKDGEPTHAEISSVWTLQLSLGVTAVVALWLAAPWFVSLWPSLPADSSWLVRCMSIGFLLTLLRVVPTVLMERRLSYGRFAILEIALTIGFYVPAIVLAESGLGVRALGSAVVAQAALGVAGAFLLQPWRPSLVLDFGLLRPILKYGVAFQSKHIFGFLQSAAAPILAGGRLGQTALGQIGWAQATAFFPLQLVTIVSRVGFPLYSRLQSDRAALARTVERSIHLCALGTFLFLSIMFGLGEPLVRVVFTERWLPAMWLLYAYGIAISLGFLTPLLIPALDAIGRPGVNLQMAILATVLIWTLVPLGVYYFGTNGFAGAYAIVVLIGNVVMLIVTRRFIPGLRILGPLSGPALAAVPIIVLAREYVQDRVVGVMSCVVGILAISIAFALLVLLVDRRAREDVRLFWRSRLARGA